jgi:acetoin utilization deacetylase AcuC-like enzyme
LRVFYTDTFVLPLPEGHKFPMEKYSRVRETLLDKQILSSNDLQIPRRATEQELSQAHDPRYVKRVLEGQLTPKETRRIGFPWSEAMVERSRRSVGATLEAASTAIKHGLGINLAGGTHHGFSDRGEGFCVFNDVVVAARQIQHKYPGAQVLVIDCDVHQGNGTAAMTKDTPSIFTFSIHGARNFPYHKQVSDLDVALADGTADIAYLDSLESALQTIHARFDPDIVFYLAGADPFEGDRFGRLGLSKQGLQERDHRVFSWCESQQIPLVITMSGGYAKDINDIVDIHVATVSCAVHQFKFQSATFTSRIPS